MGQSEGAGSQSIAVDRSDRPTGVSRALLVPAFARPEQLPFGVVLVALPEPLVTPPPVQPPILLVERIFWFFAVAPRPGVIVAVPVSVLQLVPPAAPAGAAVSTAIGARSAIAIVIRTRDFIARAPSSWSLAKQYLGI